jgi:diguanylate cyclase (GGDEF)-like protein
MGENAHSGNSSDEFDRWLSALNSMSQSLAECPKSDMVLDIVAEQMKMICDFQSLIIFSVTNEYGNLGLKPVKITGPHMEIHKNADFKLSDDALGWVITQKTPLLLADTKESKLPNVIENERSSIIIPMIVEHEIIGAIYVGASEPHTYNEKTYKLVSTVAYQAALALRCADLHEKTILHKITDGVTSLYIHRYLHERLAEACKEYEIRLWPFSLVMINLDHFRHYNDTLGHGEGDKVLREAAMLIKSYCRESDIVCRYGGDEFAIILKECHKDSSAKTAERIREAFQYRFHTYQVKITASIGVANFPEDARSKSDLVSAAEMALHRSKKGGGNQVNYPPSLGDDPPPTRYKPDPDRPPPPPDHNNPSNVRPLRPPPSLSFGYAQEIPRDRGTQSKDDQEKE